MAEIEPIRTKRGAQYPTLVSENGRLDQKRFADKGIHAVDFGEFNTRNTIPAVELRNLRGGGTSSQLRHVRTQLDIMAENTEAAFAHAKHVGKFDEWGNWYHDAHKVASDMAVKHGIPHATSAGVVAALSLGKTEWSKNVENVDTFLTLAKRGLPTPTGAFANATTAQLNNAHRIFAGGSSEEVLGDQKGGNFALNIQDPEKHADRVTNDTQVSFIKKGWKSPWAGAGGGAPDLTNPDKYDAYTDITRQVSRGHGISGSMGQAVEWMAAKDIMGGVPGTPPPSHPRFAEFYNTRDRRLPTRVRRRFQ